MRQKSKDTKKHGYRRAMLALFVVLALLVALALFLLWKVLVQYENTTPKAALDEYFSLLAEKDYDAIKADALFTPDALNSWDDYFVYLENTFGDDKPILSYRLMAGGGTNSSTSVFSAPPAASAGEAFNAGQAAVQWYAVYDEEDKKLGEAQLTRDDSAPHGWRVSALAEYVPGYTVTAPGHATILINGVELGGENSRVTEEEVAGFDALPESEERPVVRRYEVGPTLLEPEFTGSGPAGTTCGIEVDTASHTAVCNVLLNRNLEVDFAEYIETAARSYASFVTADNTYADLQQYLYPGTELAARMGEFYQGWYLEHEGYTIDDIHVENIASCSANTFTGDIHFNYIVYREGLAHTFPTSYHMYFAKQGEDWLLLELQVQ